MGTHWAKSRHRIWSRSTNEGLFIVEERCTFNDCNGVAKNRDTNDNCNGEGPDHELVCCGRYHDMGSRFPNKDHGGTRACCSEGFQSNGLRWYGKMYSHLTQCCVDGAVVTPGLGGATTCPSNAVAP